MLQVKNLTVTHKKDLHPLLEQLSFTLEAGEKMAVIGEEGNGKSTLLKCIYCRELAEEYCEISGEILTGGAVFGYLPQELSMEEKEKGVWEYMQEEPAFYEASPREVSGLAGELGISPELFYELRPMKSLSGGERVKVQLARILLEKPSILLLDEPSNDLDMETLQWLECFIKSWELPLLYISHDETLLERTANKILHLELIQRKTKPRYFVTKMGYQEYVKEQKLQFDRQEQLARKDREEMEKQRQKYLQIYQRVEHQQKAISRGDPYGAGRLKKKMHTVKSMGKRMERKEEALRDFPEREESIFFLFPKEQPVPTGKEVLQLSLDCLRMEEKVLARNLSLRVQGQEKIGIVGKNGQGKTSLLKVILEELRRKEQQKVGYMPQRYEELLPLALSPVDFLAGEGDKKERERISTYLGSLKFTREEMFHPISQLSGGQKAKLLLLQLSIAQADVLVLDEPTRNFSPLSNPVIRGLLKEYPGAIISVSHDRKYLQEVCERVYELSEEGLKEVEIK